MIAVQIKNIKNFMKELLLADTFDHFLVSEANVTTFTAFNIDGLLHPEFFEQEKAEEISRSGRTQVLWSEIRPFCLAVIKGHRTPLNFKFVFVLPPKEVALLLARSSLSIQPEDVFGLYFNCQFQSEALTITTGSSLRVFTMDKSLDRAWDNMLTDFLNRTELI